MSTNAEPTKSNGVVTALVAVVALTFGGGGATIIHLCQRVAAAENGKTALCPPVAVPAKCACGDGCKCPVAASYGFGKTGEAIGAKP